LTLQLYDDLAFLLINVIMISIVTGIIIDAFGASRDQKNFVNGDQENKCFVCGYVTAPGSGDFCVDFLNVTSDTAWRHRNSSDNLVDSSIIHDSTVGSADDCLVLLIPDVLNRVL
jgi:hypothetical protein